MAGIIMAVLFPAGIIMVGIIMGFLITAGIMMAGIIMVHMKMVGVMMVGVIIDTRAHCAGRCPSCMCIYACAFMHVHRRVYGAKVPTRLRTWFYAYRPDGHLHN